MRLRMRAGFAVASMAMAITTGCVPPSESSRSPRRASSSPGRQSPRVRPPRALGEQPAAAARMAKAAVKTANSPPTPIGQSTKTASGLVYETLKEGTGPSAVSGQTVTIHYTGTLTDGTVFDSSPRATSRRSRSSSAAARSSPAGTRASPA